MKLVVGGLQGSGRTTFANRAATFGVRIFDTNQIYATRRASMKTGYSRLSGPFMESSDDMINEYKENLPVFLEELGKFVDSFDVILADPFILNYICDNAPDGVAHTILITAPQEDQCLRTYEKERLTDPRLIGKSNSYELVKHEYIKEFNRHQSVINSLEDKVDTHIVNNGTLEQYHATIDNLLNEHNLLN